MQETVMIQVQVQLEVGYGNFWAQKENLVICLLKLDGDGDDTSTGKLDMATWQDAVDGGGYRYNYLLFAICYLYLCMTCIHDMYI